MQGINNLLFFDTESSGLPEKGTNWKTHYNEFPHIVSLAWKFEGIEHHFIINQEGRQIPEEATAIHGITTEEANASRYYFTSVIAHFICHARKADKLIGYNPYYDTSLIKASVLRKFGEDSFEARMTTEALDKSKRIDLIREAQKYFHCKWLTLQELHVKLFGIEFPSHDAMEDVAATERCYFELVKLQEQSLEL